MAHHPARRDTAAQPIELGEGVFTRAWRDARAMAGHFWRFQLPAVLLTVGFAVAGAFLPTDAEPLLRAGTTVLSVCGGILLIGLLAFFASLVLAPIRQRDEARAKVRELSAPVTDRVVLLREACKDGKGVLTRLVVLSTEDRRFEAACDWARDVWSMLRDHFPQHSQEFYGPDSEATSWMFSISCQAEINSMNGYVETYVETKLALLHGWLNRYDVPG